MGVDCGSHHELLIARFRLKLKKVGKTTRPFGYDLNQIPYEYTVEVTNTFKAKTPPVNAGDLRDIGWMPGSGRSHAEGNGSPLQYSRLENVMDRGAWRAI